jgi:hypothetical protein
MARQRAYVQDGHWMRISSRKPEGEWLAARCNSVVDTNPKLTNQNHKQHRRSHNEKNTMNGLEQIKERRLCLTGRGASRRKTMNNRSTAKSVCLLLMAILFSSSVGLGLGKVVKPGRLPVKFQFAVQYMPVYPRISGQEWNVQVPITPVIPKLTKASCFSNAESSAL